LRVRFPEHARSEVESLGVFLKRLQGAFGEQLFDRSIVFRQQLGRARPRPPGSPRWANAGWAAQSPPPATRLSN